MISELKSDDLLHDEPAWIALLRRCIDERFEVAARLLEFRTTRVRDDVVKKRLRDIERHRNLLERHIRVRVMNND